MTRRISVEHSQANIALEALRVPLIALARDTDQVFRS